MDESIHTESGYIVPTLYCSPSHNRESEPASHGRGGGGGGGYIPQRSRELHNAARSDKRRYVGRNEFYKNGKVFLFWSSQN